MGCDRSFALELPYWSSVLKKIEEQTAKSKIELIYTQYFEDNKDKVLAEIQAAEAKKRALQKKSGDLSNKVRDYQTPFTALKIDNIKKGMTPDDMKKDE